MKMIKSLLLGSAAGLVAIAGAQAADLPVKAKAVSYVKICSLYGAGFYYIPGTDTCLKVGGYVRADYRIASSQGPGYVNTAGAIYNRGFNYVGTLARGAITLDARSQTAYGTLRSYAQFGVDAVDSGQATNGGLGALPYIQWAYIQFAGFTFGSAVSFFDAYSITPFHLNIPAATNGGSGGYGTNLAAYTAQLGNGVSLSVSLEDPVPRKTAGVWDVSSIVPPPPAPFMTYAQKGVNYPDLVANIKVQQSWGWAQIMGALHDASGTWTTGLPTGVPSQDKLGWAVGAGGFFVIPGTAGDTFGIQAVYSKGATGYVTATPPAGAIGTNGGIGYLTARGGNVTVGLITDGVIGVAGAADGTVHLTEAWGIELGYEHVWQPGLKTSIAGGYNEVNYDAATSAALCAAMTPGATTCNADVSWYQIGSRTVWTPVQNLDLSVDVMYTDLNGMANGGAAAPGLVYGDTSIWSGLVRVQRNFWP